MIKIIICDDEPEVRRALHGFLLKYGKEAGVQFDVALCKSGAELLEEHRKNGSDLILLDIEMPQGNGMQAARTLREQGGEAVIIFITNMVQYALEGYGVQAYRFLEKPVTYERFVQVIEGGVAQAAKNGCSLLTVKNARGVLRLRIGDILFAETARGHVLLHCAHGSSLPFWGRQKEEGAACFGPFSFEMRRARPFAGEDYML